MTLEHAFCQIHPGRFKYDGIGTHTRTRTHAHAHAPAPDTGNTGNGILCASLQAGILVVNLQPGGSFGAPGWSRQAGRLGRPVGGRTGLAAEKCVGGSPLAGCERDPWLRPEPGSQEVIFTRPRGRPEALLEVKKIRCQTKQHVASAHHEVQPGRGCKAHEVQPGREGREVRCQAYHRVRGAGCQAYHRARGVRCQVQHRLEGTACRLSTDSGVQGRQTTRPDHRACAASAWLSAGKVRSPYLCVWSGLISRCQVMCRGHVSRSRSRAEVTCHVSRSRVTCRGHVSVEVTWTKRLSK